MSTIPEEWDIRIRPKSSLFDLKLKDVWHYRDLMWLFVRRDFVAQYKQTVLGPVWHFIQPMLTSLMFLVVFNRIAHIPTDGIDPIVFYMAGNVIWTYFSTCLTATSNTFTANATIFGKVYFPRLVLPLSIVVSNMVKFGIQFLLLLLTILYSHLVNGYNYSFGINILFIPLLIILMAALGLGAGIIISALTTKYRDFTVLVGFAVQLMMYITPVIYPLSYLNATSTHVQFIQYNPLTPIVEAFKYCILGHGLVTLSGILYSVFFALATLLFGAIIFNKVDKTFMDTV